MSQISLKIFSVSFIIKDIIEIYNNITPYKLTIHLYLITRSHEST